MSQYLILRRQRKHLTQLRRIAVFELRTTSTWKFLPGYTTSNTNLTRVDISSEEGLQEGFAKFQKDFDNALDICVPCAGINRHLPFLEFTYKDHQDLLSINVLGLYFTAQLAAKQMIANGTKHGSIVLVASMASHIAVRSQLCSAYCGTKGAVRSMCPAIAKELAEYVSQSHHFS
jgi:NAD(P)-dependent dehydrogenase (short-subunit alcohol dehydrogenase family)